MRRRRRTPTSLQRMFLALVLSTLVLFFIVEIFHNSKVYPSPPAYVLQKTYVSVECGDRRLGNAMFMYAAVIGIAKRLNASTLLQSDCRVTQVFELKATIVANFQAFLPVHSVYEEFGRRASAFDHNAEKIPRRNTLLKGYFQSWRYFRDAVTEVRDELVFPRSTLAVAGTFLQDNLPSDWRGSDFIRVGIHVRRGDILKDHYKNYGYTTGDPAYYRHAMDYFSTNHTRVQFVVCSDDIQWAKANIHGKHVIYSEQHRDFEDMAILSQCNHTIISVGSFGWWAAWIANGTTIYYEKWPKEYSKLEYHVNKKTYFPPWWISMQ